MATGLKTEADELEYLVEELDTAYEVGDPCIASIDVVLDGKVVVEAGQEVPNRIYDLIRKRLKEIRPTSTTLATVTASKSYSGQATVVHEPPLTSLEKITGVTKVDDYKGWLKFLRKQLGYKDLHGKIVQSYKRDGVALALYYVDGILVAAALRPRDGIHGEDVLANVKFLQGIPLTLPLPITCSIRGEVDCLKGTFEPIKADWRNPKYGLDKEPANSRNYTAGSIRQFKNPEITGQRGLTFTGYAIEALHAPAGIDLPCTKREQAKWANQVLKIPFVRVEFHEFADLQHLEDMVPKLDYDVDGVVLAWDNLDEYEQLGRHGDRPTGNPRGAVAWKFADEVAKTPYTGCDWSLNRTGVLTPVAQFVKPLYLAQTNVRQCSLHNIGFMARNGIVPGVELEVIKSGKIIPKVIAVNFSDGRRVRIDEKSKVKRAFVEAIPYPKTCPACGHPTHLEEGGEGMWSLRCINPLCPAQVISTMTHFLSTLGLKGVGDSQIEKLLVAKKIATPADFFRLDVPDLKDAGLSDRQALLALGTIWGVEAPSKMDDGPLRDEIAQRRRGMLKIPAWQVFAALGIPGAGKQTGKDLIDYFRSFSVLLALRTDELVAVPGVGETTAEMIVEFFHANGNYVRDLLNFIDPQLPPSGGKLQGVTFCLTGNFSKGKKDAEKRIAELGGKVVGGVSKGVHYLVCGVETGTGKKDAAKALKDKGHSIEVITEADLEAML